MKLLKPGLILLIISLLAACALAATNEVTKGPIEEQRLAAKNEAMRQVMEDAASFEDMELGELAVDTVKSVSIAKDGEGNAIGMVVVAYPGGYGGPIEVIVGLKTSGEVSGVRIGSHAETPGLGAKSKEPEFFMQYNGKDAASGVGVVKNSPSENDIVAISGATITSRGVTKGVNAAAEMLKKCIEGGLIK